MDKADGLQCVPNKNREVHTSAQVPSNVYLKVLKQPYMDLYSKTEMLDKAGVFVDSSLQESARETLKSIMDIHNFPPVSYAQHYSPSHGNLENSPTPGCQPVDLSIRTRSTSNEVVNKLSHFDRSITEDLEIHTVDDLEQSSLITESTRRNMTKRDHESETEQLMNYKNISCEERYYYMGRIHTPEDDNTAYNLNVSAQSALKYSVSSIETKTDGYSTEDVSSANQSSGQCNKGEILETVAEKGAPEPLREVTDLAQRETSSTKRVTDWSVGIFNRWMKDSPTRANLPSLLNMTIPQTNTYLCKFLVEARKSDGTRYPSKSLQALGQGLLRFVRNGRACPSKEGKSTDGYFKPVNQVLSIELRRTLFYEELEGRTPKMRKRRKTKSAMLKSTKYKITSHSMGKETGSPCSENIPRKRVSLERLVPNEEAKESTAVHCDGYYKKV